MAFIEGLSRAWLGSPLTFFPRMLPLQFERAAAMFISWYIRDSLLWGWIVVHAGGLTS